MDAITVTAPPAHHRAAWRTLLSELNPLQYLPVVGTIYRAVTGDTIPETVREAGSLVVSGLTGGPVGVAIGVGALLVEQALGIDPEAIGQRMLAGIGIGHPSPPSATPPAPPPPAPPARAPWSPGELAAYGVTRTAEGTLRGPDATGADVLNGLELRRLHALA